MRGPCELPLAFDAFSQTYQALPRQEGRFVLDRRWFECCVAPAEPCHLAVWKVKACPLKGSDVFFVSPHPSLPTDRSCCVIRGATLAGSIMEETPASLPTHQKPRAERWEDALCSTYVTGSGALTSKTVRSPRRCSRSRAICTRRDRTGGGSLRFLRVVNCKRGGREVRTMRRGG